MCVIGRTLRYVVGAIFAVFILGGVGVNAANAQQPGAPTVAAFLANPGQLLQQNPNGGPLLAGISSAARAFGSLYVQSNSWLVAKCQRSAKDRHCSGTRPGRED